MNSTIPDDPDSSEFVFVYRYLYWDEASQSRKVSNVCATEEAIRTCLGKRLDSGRIRVPRSDVLGGGIYIVPK
jgi:hypothetical protein